MKATHLILSSILSDIYPHSSHIFVVINPHCFEERKIPDEEYKQAGAEILSTAAEVWSRADLIVKVKEPQASEYEFLRPDLLLFTYLHLAPLPELTERLIAAS